MTGWALVGAVTTIFTGYLVKRNQSMSAAAAVDFPTPWPDRTLMRRSPAATSFIVRLVCVPFSPKRNPAARAAGFGALMRSDCDSIGYWCAFCAYLSILAGKFAGVG